MRPDASFYFGNFTQFFWSHLSKSENISSMDCIVINTSLASCGVFNLVIPTLKQIVQDGRKK